MVTVPVLDSAAEGMESMDMVNEPFPEPEVLLKYIHKEFFSTTQLPEEVTEIVFSADEGPVDHDSEETLRVYGF